MKQCRLRYKMYNRFLKAQMIFKILFYSEMKMWRQWNGKNVDTAH